ncbi:MAG: 3-dehydroquinate synthase [Alphaproteobacteria bacterium]|nr:3-dehydroquinate synthase [Alphaproteobacteria bacterium]
MRATTILKALGGRSIVLVGIMGSGKTSVGRRLAARLGLDFVDADHEIEAAAGMTIAEIFARDGEAYFRDGERRVIARLLDERQRVVATGGGAFMNARTRDKIALRGFSIWLNASFDVVMKRVRKRNNRPLLQTSDPEAAMRRLMQERYPVYALADLEVPSTDGPHEAVIDTILERLAQTFATPPGNGKMDMEKTGQEDTDLRVALAGRDYAIRIGPGLIAQAGDAIHALAPGAACAIVTDANVAQHHLATLTASLDAKSIRHTLIVLPPGEETKSIANFARVCDSIIAGRMERGDLVIALGGGVIGDLAGFAASCVRRGMRFVQIPTSLLSQVDSSVGGKTAINSVHGKNLIGAFYQPALVLADTQALATLPEREFRAGYAEVVKYGVIGNLPFFEWLEKNWQAVFARGPELAHAIRTSCAAKAAVVERDETEQGDRALLNLGHTFGHALEALLHYDSTRLVHGEGVAIGINCAMRFSVRLGHASVQEAERVAAHFRATGLPVRINEIAGWNFSSAQILDAMFQDKKVQRGALTFILARGIGQSFIARGVPSQTVSEFLQEELSRR